jgi:hypothetical protein
MEMEMDSKWTLDSDMGMGIEMGLVMDMEMGGRKEYGWWVDGE